MSFTQLPDSHGLELQQHGWPEPPQLTLVQLSHTPALQTKPPTHIWNNPQHCS
jgi:hypothetical protein